MKRLLPVLMVIIVVVASVLAGCSKAAPAPVPAPAPAPAPAPKAPVILRLVVPAPPGDMLTVKDEELSARIKERTSGAYEIKIFPGEQLAKIPEYLDAVRTGAVEIMDVAWGIYGGLDPRIGASEIPFLFTGVEASAAAMDQLLPLHDKVFMEKFNQKALAVFTTGGMEVESTKSVKALADWKGLLVGAINPQLAALTSILGGSSVVVMWTDLYSNLEKGVIDATMSGTQGAMNTKLTDVIDYVTIFYGSTGSNAYNINLDVWKAMPADVQNIFIEETRKTARTMNDTFVKLHDEDITKLKGMGIDVYVLPKDERARWAQLVQPYINEQLNGLGDFGQQIKAIADKVNAQYPYK